MYIFFYVPTMLVRVTSVSLYYFVEFATISDFMAVAFFLLGPVVQSNVSLTSSLVVKMLSVLVSTLYNI